MAYIRKDFGDFRTANRRDVTEAIGRSDLNIGRCSSRHSGPDVLDFTPENVTKSCTVWVEAGVVGSTGGNSMLLTLDHSARASCLNYEIAIADLQYSAYLVWNSER